MRTRASVLAAMLGLCAAMPSGTSDLDTFMQQVWRAASAP
jgi:hypothetical protein